ncbi:hypothetical protein N7462_003414 [Penicillium macrosclerotiorum]|uniref:uncharacterized protein n=1 Tax=Penicillium macrosclerotiorum TaxID=303699 RepID=UPI002546C9AE|nr:uncharacterized protein N7462_003414 [Penicillium macrosclerotiorum]KAJ5689022.1 hypothetical protein N7462_003414 [Penicillium macrosclerotiorum]
MNDPESAQASQDSNNSTTMHHTSYEPACDECRVRKVKCNKEYPKCSNCQKSNLSCGFSNKGKRVNHTKRLINDVELLGNRLGKIEDVLSRCLSVMENSSSMQAHQKSTPSWNDRQESSPMELPDDAMQDSEHFDDDSLVKLQSDRYYLFVGEHGYERFYGLSSMFTLYAEAQNACGQLMASLPDYSRDEALQSSTSALRCRLEEATKLFEMMAQESPSVLEPNPGDLAPSIPPRALMEVFLDTYVSDLCPLLPIFDPRSILSAMEEQYSADTELPDLAWVTSFNHILLQTLAAKLGASRKSGLVRGGSLEDGLVSNLLLNAERCYNNFEKLLRPRVANIQALLSLALIALKYFRFTMFETLFAQACQLSKSIGLHHAISRHGTTSGHLEIERQNLFWSLFIVDKHASLIAGKPCLLPSYDCSVPLPTDEDHFTARVRLAHIHEELYRNLYSAEVRRIGRESINRRGEKIGRRLRSWAVQHEHVLSPPGPGPISPPNKYCAMELRYALSTCWVLIQRRMITAQSRKSRLGHARDSLTLFKGLCASYQHGDGISGFTVFENQISESLRSLKEGSRAQSQSAAVSPRPTTASTDQGPGGDLFGMDAMGSFPASSGARDQFWDVYSFPLGDSLDSGKINTSHEAQADNRDLMDTNGLFLMSEDTTSHILPTDAVDFDSFLSGLSSGNHEFGRTI